MDEKEKEIMYLKKCQRNLDILLKPIKYFRYENYHERIIDESYNYIVKEADRLAKIIKRIKNILKIKK